LPTEVNPLAQSGTAANFALAVAVLSGIGLLVWYSPSLEGAHASVAGMAAPGLGSVFRTLHRTSSDLAMLLILVHAVRTGLAGKFRGPRWLPWITGVGLAVLVWFIGWTGYWLIWDQPAQQVAVTSMRLLDSLRIFGEPLERLYLADRLVPSLLFFVVFFLHLLLPLAIAIGLALHLARLSRARLFPGRKLMLALAAGLMLASILAPAPLDEPARMAIKPAAFRVDAWYLTPLALALRFQDLGLWIAIFGTTAIAASLPWLGRREPTQRQAARVEPSRCHACTQCVQDCPFDAISMVPRTDNRRLSSQAWVDPDRCVACGVCTGSCDSEAMSLPWFDTVREEGRIAAAIESAGVTPWVALVGADLGPHPGDRGNAEWEHCLPGYQIHPVPTASWVRPKFVERLLTSGVKGVLVVRDGRVESSARDGNRWVSERLEGRRKPILRPSRFPAEGRFLVLDHDPSRTSELGRQAAAFRNVVGKPTSDPIRNSGWKRALAGGGMALGLAAAVVVPSRLKVANPAPAGPELVFSFTAYGAMEEPAELDPEEQAALPVHMRGRPTEKPRRAPVIVRLEIDGAREERSYEAKGWGEDGPAIGEWRQDIAPGEHRVALEVIADADEPPLRWAGQIQAEPRHISVLTFDPRKGFRLE